MNTSFISLMGFACAAPIAGFAVASSAMRLARPARKRLGRRHRHGLRNSKGVVRACMTGEVAHFPSCKNPAASYNLVGDAADSVTLTFRDVKPGRYAIALLHDENDNGKADRAAMMIPTEGFGFSRDARVRFGPPKFGEAAFDVAPGTNQKLAIRMRYIL